jgi:hypothetical protein
VPSPQIKLGGWLSGQSLAAVNYAVRILLVRLPAYLRMHALIVRPDRTAPLRQRDDLIQQKFFRVCERAHITSLVTIGNFA